MGTKRSRILLGIASAFGMFRSTPVFGGKPVLIGIDQASGPDETVEAEIVNGKVKSARRILPEGIKPQNTKLNKAEAKRYRKQQIALRNQTRAAAGMVC